jgi:hypothetical protein
MTTIDYRWSKQFVLSSPNGLLTMICRAPFCPIGFPSNTNVSSVPLQLSPFAITYALSKSMPQCFKSNDRSVVLILSMREAAWYTLLPLIMFHSKFKNRS